MKSFYVVSTSKNVNLSENKLFESDRMSIELLINTRDILGCNAARVKVSDGLFFDSFQYVIDYGAMTAEFFLSSWRYSERRVSENLLHVD
ncbi:MAG: hypothetical protein AABX85_02255 [Nanoarchaeota archaeon]